MTDDDRILFMNDLEVEYKQVLSNKLIVNRFTLAVSRLELDKS